mmetsp:Transcript_12004/g.21840  ORF Transcript_12004/g.21840 Transcript_12004/m.21840 type:complete len:211 (+) Transcript_12004:2474-3106(+)
MGLLVFRYKIATDSIEYRDEETIFLVFGERDVLQVSQYRFHLRGPSKKCHPLIMHTIPNASPRICSWKLFFETNPTAVKIGKVTKLFIQTKFTSLHLKINAYDIYILVLVENLDPCDGRHRFSAHERQCLLHTSLWGQQLVRMINILNMNLLQCWNLVSSRRTNQSTSFWVVSLKFVLEHIRFSVNGRLWKRKEIVVIALVHDWNLRRSK